MSEPPVAPTVTTAPARSRWSKVPAHLGRARTSTLILGVLFLAIGTLYLNIRPETVATTTVETVETVDQQPAETTEPAAPTTAEPTTPATTTAPEPTTAEETTPTGEPTATTARGGSTESDLPTTTTGPASPSTSVVPPG